MYIWSYVHIWSFQVIICNQTRALESLTHHLANLNASSSSPYKITCASKLGKSFEILP